MYMCLFTRHCAICKNDACYWHHGLCATPGCESSFVGFEHVDSLTDVPNMISKSRTHASGMHACVALAHMGLACMHVHVALAHVQHTQTHMFQMYRALLYVAFLSTKANDHKRPGAQELATHRVRQMWQRILREKRESNKTAEEKKAASAEQREDQKAEWNKRNRGGHSNFTAH